MPDRYRCSKCRKNLPPGDFHQKQHPDKGRPVQSRCRRCRSTEDRTNEYGRQRYTNPCLLCEMHRKLNSNAICGPCNAKRGLKQCRVCGDLLPLLLSFYLGRATCKECYVSPRES